MRKLNFLLMLFLSLLMVEELSAQRTLVNPKTALRAAEGPDSLMVSTNTDRWEYKSIDYVDKQQLSYNPTTKILSLDNSSDVDLSGLAGSSTTTQEVIIDAATGSTVDVPSLPGSPQNITVIRSGLFMAEDGGGSRDWSRSGSTFIFNQALDGERLIIRWEE